MYTSAKFLPVKDRSPGPRDSRSITVVQEEYNEINGSGLKSLMRLCTSTSTDTYQVLLERLSGAQSSSRVAILHPSIRHKHESPRFLAPHRLQIKYSFIVY